MTACTCVLCGVAAAMAATGNPAGWRALQSAHVSDGRGGCRSCRDVGRGTAQPWPCALRLITEMAEQIYDSRRTTSVGGESLLS